MNAPERPGALAGGAPTYSYEQEGDRQFATTLARGLEILRCFTPLEPILGNKDISVRTGLPKPTVSRLTYTLTRLGYLKHNARLGKYQLGSAVLSISYPLLANIQVRQVARPYMKELADYARGWVSMGVRDRLNMVYIETARSMEVVRSRPDIGQSFPIIAASMGRAYLAGLPETARNAVLNEVRVKTPELWRKYGARVEEGLADFRSRGFCLRQGDLIPDVHSVGVPMAPQPDGDGVVFNCAVPLHALRRGQLENDLGPRLVQLVRTVESLLGLR